MKNRLLIVFAFIGYTVMGQVNLNEYKYIIIPKKLGDFKEENQYQTSTILKYEFGEKGFLAVYDDALPDDLFSNRCLGLVASLNDGSSLFATKLSVVLMDCKGQEIFRTKEGKSKIKEYNPAYRDAITQAMTSFNAINYSYKEKLVATPSANGLNYPNKEKLVGQEPVTVSFKNDVKKLEEGAGSLKKTEIVPKNRDAAVKQIATTTEQSYKDVTPVASEIKQGASKLEASGNNSGSTDALYAQPLENGYQLVDSSPKVRIKLLNSSIENVYIAQGDGKSGMVFKKGETWVFEYYAGDKLVQEELNINF